MASKLSLNATNLEALGAARLAELLMELSGGDAVAKRQLRLALAAGSSAEEAAREVRKRLVAIARSESYIDWRKRKTLVSDLQAQHRAITGAIATADPALALDLLWRFLELAEGIMDRCSDSTGTVIEVFQQAVLDLGPLASAAQADPLALAEQVTEALAENGYGQFDQLIPAVAEALGEKGLAHLEQECRERGAQPGHPSLLTIAECRGDVDAYVSQFTEDDLQWPDSAAQVAERLLKADRAQEALAVLDQAARAPKPGMRPTGMTPASQCWRPSVRGSWPRACAGAALKKPSRCPTCAITSSACRISKMWKLRNGPLRWWSSIRGPWRRCASW